MDNDYLPILGVVGRTTGHLRLTVSDNTQQATIQPQFEKNTAFSDQPLCLQYTLFWKRHSLRVQRHSVRRVST